MSDPTLTLAVHEAVASVDDPEYPGISIVDLGLLEVLEIADGSACIGLVPTFSGCPALGLIAEQVTAAVQAVEGVTTVDVEWLRAPAWTVDRVSADARAAMARDFTVSVQLGAKPAPCPRCGGDTVQESLFGPSRCRAVHRCPACSETVEVMRS
ncbi:MAG: iron-sulfur cluster assembly protein [Actinomycetota bacterium]